MLETGGQEKKLSMQGVRGQAILLCEFIRLDFFRDWVFEEGAYLFIKNKFRHTFYYRDDPTPSVLKHTYQYIKILHCNIINCYIAVLRTKSLYTSMLNFKTPFGILVLVRVQDFSNLESSLFIPTFM